MNSTVEVLPLTYTPPAQCVYSDAMNYLQVVKWKRPEIYPTFCVKLIDYLSGSGEPLEVIRYAAVTFQNDVDLSSGFRKFLPPDDTIFLSMLKVVAWKETLKDTRGMEPLDDASINQVRKLKPQRKLKFKSERLKFNKENGKRMKFKASVVKASKSKAVKDVTNAEVQTPKKVRNSPIDHAAMYKTRNALFSPKKVSLLPEKFSRHRPPKSNASSLNLFPYTLKFIPESVDVLSNEEKLSKENAISEAAASTSNFASLKLAESSDLPTKSESQSTVSCASVYPGSMENAPNENQKTQRAASFDLLCYEYNDLIEILENVKIRFKKRRDIYKIFLKYLDDYQEEICGDPMNNDLLMRSMLDIQLHQRICDLFENEMDILPNLNRFIRYLGSVTGKVSDIDKLLE